MTTFDRFDPFERRIGAALEGLAPPQRLDYLDDVFRQTARTAQRPRWSFLERWLNVDTTLARPMLFGRRVPIRSLLLLAVLAALLAATAVYVGTQKKLPAPFGPAANGQLLFGADGDIYARDSLAADPRLLIRAEGEQGGPAHSPDGQLFAYDSIESGAGHVWVANADGTQPRQVLERAFTGQSFAWAPDSRSMAIVTHASKPELWIAQADGSGARLVEIEGLYPWEATWDPQRPGVLLVRAEEKLTKAIDLYFVDLSGSILSKIDLEGDMLNGAQYEFSGVAISPDGNTIAFNSVEAVEPPFNRFRVHTMGRDGSNDRLIPAPLETLYSQAWAQFSPDGSWIAMESWATGADGSSETRISRLAVAPADGSGVARWLGPSAPGQTLVTTWSPDGTRILLCIRERGEVYAIDPVTGSAERVPGLSDLPDWQRVAR
jgi:Tol biopolymer transport system component